MPLESWKNEKKLNVRVININTQEKRAYFKKFHAEVLTSNEANKEILEQFSAIDIGKSLEKYLHEDAWKKDEEGETRVYLVKDDDGKIALFFLLNVDCYMVIHNMTN